MTESPDTTQEAEASPTPAPAETSEEKTPKETTPKPGGVPVGQIAVGGLGATVLGSAALASVVGPLGWLAAPAVATAGGVGYVAYKTRKRRGRRSSSGRSQQTKTTTTRSMGGSRLGSSGMVGGRGRTASTASRSGGVAAAPRRAGGGAAGSARPSGGSSARPGSRAGGASRPGASPRGAAPRGGTRGTTPRGGGLFGRGGSDTTASKKRSSRPSSGGTSTSPRGGSMSKSRWGGSSGPTTAPGGRVKRAARAARDWADDRTGRKASSAFKAARKEKGFRARSKAASRAVRKKGGGKAASGIVGVFAAIFAGFASLFGGSKKKPTRAADTTAPADSPAARYARDGYKLGPEVPGHPGMFYADPRDTRPGYVDRRGLDPDHPGYATGSYDANVDPRTWDERVAAGDVPGFSPKTSTTHTGGTTMAGLPAAVDAHQMAANMSRYAPPDAWAVVAESKQWADVPTQVAMAVKCYADRLEAERFPLNPAVVEKLHEFAQAFMAIRAIADEIPSLLHRAHREDIARRESTRGDERKWNV